jgi:glycerate 2-kinase (EC 2.7.1.-)
LLVAPAPGLTLADKQTMNRSLLRSGATITEMNCVRKHLSSLKGGRLALACHPANVVTLLISDVPGDDPAVIASGPTVADPTTFAEARAIVEKSDCRTRHGPTPTSARRGRKRPNREIFAWHVLRPISSPRPSIPSRRLRPSHGRPGSRP